MKFMVSWRVHKDKRHDVMKNFAQMTPEHDKADMGDHIRLIGRWHDLVGFTGFAVFEADDPKAIASWLLNWNAVLDVEVIVPVLDDEEAREVGKTKTAEEV